MNKTAEFIEEANAAKSLTSTKPQRRKIHPNSLKNLAPYPKGVSGNPGGVPKYDVAAEIARAVLEGNREAAYAGLTKALCKGNAYVFKELAERGYGKLKEHREVTHIYQDVPDTDIEKRISELLADLGLAAQIDAAGGTEKPQAGASKANGHAKDSDLLPR